MNLVAASKTRQTTPQGTHSLIVLWQQRAEINMPNKRRRPEQSGPNGTKYHPCSSKDVDEPSKQETSLGFRVINLEKEAWRTPITYLPLFSMVERCVVYGAVESER